MKLEKYENKSKKKRKAILISLGVIVLISVSFLLYKTFASFTTESAEFPIMNGKVDYFGNSDVYFAFYKGKEKVEEMPQKDNKENLVFDHGECDNGASITWDSGAWGPIVKNLSKSKTKCSLYFREYNAADYIIELAKTDTINLIADDTNDANIRYIGVSPNNYIDIGDKDSDGNPILWRIIGVMNNIINLDNGGQQESLIKIIRAESIGEYVWDSSIETMNGGAGVNEWSQADLMKLLNPNTVYSGTPKAGGSLYWNRGSGSCYNDINEKYKECDFTSNGLSEEAKKKIAKVRWNTGTIGEPFNENRDKVIAKYMYEGERSTHNGREQCEGKELIACNDTVPRMATWDGYIGLMYPSDYGYAVDKNFRNACLTYRLDSYSLGNCAQSDWLKLIDGSVWTMTSTPASSNSYDAFVILKENGNIGGYVSIASMFVFPVAYLKSSLKILSNPQSDKVYGSKGNPFVLS